MSLFITVSSVQVSSAWIELYCVYKSWKSTFKHFFFNVNKTIGYRLNKVHKQASQQSLSMRYLSLQTIQSEVRHVMTSVRSYISLLTSILGDCAGRGRQLLITLRNCEDKCTTLLEWDVLYICGTQKLTLYSYITFLLSFQVNSGFLDFIVMNLTVYCRWIAFICSISVTSYVYVDVNTLSNFKNSNLIIFYVIFVWY